MKPQLIALKRPDEVFFNKIYILQSLDSTELWTAEDIGRLIHYIGLREKNVLVELLNINSSAGFINKLDHISREIKVGALPYIHFEMHGAPEGLSLTNGEIIPWQDLKEPLRNLNILSKNNLFISLATCYGSHLLSIYKPFEPCPFYGYLAPLKEAGDRDLHASFVRFFETLLVKNDFDLAITEIISNDSSIDWVFLNCRAYFDQLKVMYAEDYNNPRVLRQRVNEVVRSYRLKNPNSGRTRKELTREAESLFRNGVVGQIFDEMQKTFFHK
jgi:hypothetical protein